MQRLSDDAVYHTLCEQFREAISHGRQLLSSGGLFWSTCHTRRDGEHGFGIAASLADSLVAPASGLPEILQAQVHSEAR